MSKYLTTRYEVIAFSADKSITLGLTARHTKRALTFMIHSKIKEINAAFDPAKGSPHLIWNTKSKSWTDGFVTILFSGRTEKDVDDAARYAA